MNESWNDFFRNPLEIGATVLLSVLAGFITAFIIHLARQRRKLDEDYYEKLSEKKMQEQILESFKKDFPLYESAMSEIRLRELLIQLRATGLNADEIEKRLREIFFRATR